jgi:GTP-binding protein EngB required for normal cell division
VYLLWPELLKKRERLYKYFISLIQVIKEILQMKCVIFVGDTRTGKSSALRDLTGDQSIICGKGNLGSSTTTNIQIYKSISPKLSPNYIFMDTVGRGDNSLQITPEEIREQI